MSVTMFVVSDKMQSDSDSEPEYADSVDDRKQRFNAIYAGEVPVVLIRPSEKVYEGWSNIPIKVKKEAGQLMRVCTFWYPILLQPQETNNTTRWAVQVGFIDSNHQNDLTLKRLYKIETLEMILSALEKGCYNLDQTRHAVFISNKFNLNAKEVLEDAMAWLERADDKIIKRVQELGHKQLCFTILHHLFTEYAQYMRSMGDNKESTMKSLKASPNQWAVEKSDAMRIKGNEHFTEKNYEAAVKCYSKAIRYHPENHIIYGNRALCYIRCEKYLKAIGDGKRAILIMPLWAKGHYRYSEALFSLGEIKKAIEANSHAQVLCKGDREGVKDLEQQQIKFLHDLDIDTKDTKLAICALDKKLKSLPSGRLKEAEPYEIKPELPETEVIVTHKPAYSGKSYNMGVVMKTNPGFKPGNGEKNPKQSKEYKAIREITGGPQGKMLESVYNSHAKDASKMGQKRESSVPALPGLGSAPRQSSPGPKQKAEGAEKRKADGTTKKKADAADKKGTAAATEESSAANKKKDKEKKNKAKDTVVADSKPDMRVALRSAVQDAHVALTNLCSRNAEQAFSTALALIDANTPKELGMSTLDVVLLLYGRASALTEIGQVQELAEAQREYEKIKSYEERTFQCFVYYGIGKVYLKENRYPEAQSQFSDSLQMVKNQITPGKLTWPLTKEIVKETDIDYFKELLSSAMDLCKFPPRPDAICSHEACLGHLKIEIYFTDPDFKGFIRIGCCQSCVVEYHMNCWKTLKAAAFSDRNDKDFLQEPCFTPDCVGKINSIHIYGSTGLIKCKFETVIPKPEGPKKLKVNQTCSSLKKIKLKEERKLKRKQHRQASDEDDQSERSENDHIPQENAVGQSLEKASSQEAWLLYRDRVLLQISERLQSLQQEKRFQRAAELWGSLRPWVELDQARGNALAISLLGGGDDGGDGGQRQEPQTLGQVAELLLERKNRVWARVFVHFLCSCSTEISPKLHDWASQLDSAGLDAAKEFLERYSVVLEELDKTVLFTFVPMNAVLQRNAQVVSGSTVAGLTGLTEQDHRLLIWTLEEHRHEFVHLHTILDEYFEMMDGHCLVIKKTENENEHNSPIKAKNKSRKKKQKETKPIIILSQSGMRGGTQREEREQDFLDEDDSLLFLNQNEPFSVPNHLREQVADFEEQYSGAGSNFRYKNILDNNPDPTKESLYDYFAQILEEHGPLSAEDPLLVGELSYFPAVARQQIVACGGLRPFLLESLRFVAVGQQSVGLTTHAAAVLPDRLGGLDDLDVIEPYPPSVSSASADFIPSLPSPYLYNGVLSPLVSGEGRDLAASYCAAEPQLFCTSDLDRDLDLYTSHMEDDDGSGGGAASEGHALPMGESASRTPAAGAENLARKQSVEQVKRAVAVNTEKLEPFEVVNNGEINKMQRSLRELERNIHAMKNNQDRMNARRGAVLAILKDEYAEMSEHTQVMNKELALFQQKLEDEVKRDQREKKENQETLKALKMDIKALGEAQESISKSTKEKMLSYDRQLERFLELSNQSAAEKMSLEDEIRRCKELCAKANRRSQAAQLSNLENQRDQALHDLYRSRSDAKAILAKLEEVAPRFPPQVLSAPRASWRACVQEAEEKISNVESQYQVQMDQVKKGIRLGSLPSISVPSAPQTPVVPPITLHQLPQSPPSQSPFDGPQAARGPAGPPGHQAPHPHTHPEGMAAVGAASSPPLGAKTKTQTKTLEAQQPPTVFERVLEHLSSVFPDYTRLDLIKFLQEFRVMTPDKRQLNSMAFQDVASGVTQIILDHQERTSLGVPPYVEQVNSGAGSNRSTPQRSGTPVAAPGPAPVPVWQTLGGGNRPSHALNVDDPCIICHDEMTAGDVCVLDCRHSFHKECIKAWLREQSTCPTCREHAVLPEDFPMLPAAGRMMRRDPHPSANLS